MKGWRKKERRGDGAVWRFNIFGRVWRVIYNGKATSLQRLYISLNWFGFCNIFPRE